MAKFARYCACGGTLIGRVYPDQLADRLGEVWDRVHGGDDCGPATAKEAARARADAEKAEVAVPRRRRRQPRYRRTRGHSWTSGRRFR